MLPDRACFTLHDVGLHDVELDTVGLTAGMN
jgi:hypothetical protein